MIPPGRLRAKEMFHVKPVWLLFHVKHSFADTELGEDLPQQIVSGHFPGDLTEGALRQPQLFSKQLELPCPLLGPDQIIRRSSQRIQMARTREECPLLARTPAQRRQHLGSQVIQARAGECRYFDLPAQVGITRSRCSLALSRFY